MKPLHSLHPFILLLVLTAHHAQANDSLLTTAYSFGAGIGATSIQGDYVRSSPNLALGGGFDLHRENFFFVARGHTSIDNNGQAADFALGLGNRWIKAGLGYNMTGGDFGTLAGPVAVAGGTLAGIVVADPSRESSLRLSSISPYLRLTPVHTRDTLVNLDAWYGVAAQGEEKIPVTVLGLNGHLLTEPVSAGGMKGVSLQVAHRLTNNVALFGTYHWRTATQDGASARVAGDVLGSYNVVPVPYLTYNHRALMVGVMLVND